MANTLHFVLAGESVECICVRLLFTCKWSFLGFHKNASVVRPSSLSRDNVDFVSCSSNGIVSRNVVWLDAHFHNENPAVWSKLIIPSVRWVHLLWLRFHLSHQHRNHCSTLEQPLGTVVRYHLQVSWGSVLPGMELKNFHMWQWWVCTLGWDSQKNISIRFFVSPCLVDE